MKQGFAVPIMLAIGFALVTGTAIGIGAGTIAHNKLKPSPSPQPSPASKASPQIAVSPTPTAAPIPVDWLTSTNETIGFQIKHPQDFNVSTRASLSGFYPFVIDGVFKDVEQVSFFSHDNPDLDLNPTGFIEQNPLLANLESDIKIQIGNILGIQGNEELQKLAEEHRGGTYSLDSQVSDEERYSGIVEEIIIDGANGYQISGRDTFEYFTLLPKNESNQAIYIKVDILRYTDPESSSLTNPNSNVPFSPRYEKNKKLFKQILSTFQFLD